MISRSLLGQLEKAPLTTVAGAVGPDGTVGVPLLGSPSSGDPVFAGSIAVAAGV